MIFWRIVNDKLYVVKETDKLGFEVNEGLYIPDEYLEKQEFMVMRTCFGMGDVGIISAMPRLLKEKYPECRVYVPSSKLLQRLFNGLEGNWSSWGNPFNNAELVFKNNPWVDSVKDHWLGEIYTDHYRIYDDSNLAVPLVEQMLKFWQFTDDEIKDSAPELYWSDEERVLGDQIIEEHTMGEGDFGCLLISERYDFTQDQLIIEHLREHKMPYFYYSAVPLERTDFQHEIDPLLDLRHVDPRVQLYIRSRAVVNISNHCGMADLMARYSDVYEVQRQFPQKHNFVRGVEYIDSEFKRVLLDGLPDKTESKTTTSRKWKADVIDYCMNTLWLSDSLNGTLLEVGSSLGASTRMFSGLFNKVIAVDNLVERHEKSAQLNSDRDNITYVTMDVYQQPWDFGEVGAVFIDCIHDAEHLTQDIDN